MYGRVDVLVNNAGILRDKSFANMSDKEWDAIYDVHLKGAYVTTRAAWNVFRKQNFGRIVMTSSNSGVYGNFGQTNYSSAKLGLVGFANSLAIEGAKYNIHTNVIVPTAASRMTEGILPEVFFKELKPKLIAPVVVYLCHENCEDNGAIIESAAGWATKLHIVRGKGAFLRTSINSEVSPESVRNAWSKITDMSKAERFETIAEASGSLMSVLEQLQQQNEKSSDVKIYSEDFVFTNKDIILYNLGVGANVRVAGDLKYLYENDSSFSAIPTFFIQPGLLVALQTNIVADAIKKDIDLSQVFHGEQYMEVIGSLPTDGVLRTNSYVVDILDKRSGAVVVINSDTLDASGNLLVKAQSSVFIVGAGNFGGNNKPNDKVVNIAPTPNRAPDASIEVKSSVNQAALFRLSGDLNPMHIDPNFSTIAGHKIPIMHGLCTLGLSVSAIIRQYAKNDPALFKAVKARFAKPCIPGQTLQVQTWRNGNRIHFKTTVVETGVEVLSGAYVDLASVSGNKTAATKLQSDAIFENIQAKIDENPAKAKMVNGVFLYKILDGGKVAKEWTLDLKNGKIYNRKADGIKIDTTLSVADNDFIEIVTGKLNPQSAFMKGKLKITGNIMLTQKLIPLLKNEAKL